jgi:hypothetical protein
MGWVKGATYCVVVVGGRVVVVVVDVVDVVDVVGGVVVVGAVVDGVVVVEVVGGTVVEVVVVVVVVVGAVVEVAVGTGASAASSGDPHVANNRAPAATVIATPGTANRHCPLTAISSS